MSPINSLLLRGRKLGFPIGFPQQLSEMATVGLFRSLISPLRTLLLVRVSATPAAGCCLLCPCYQMKDKSILYNVMCVLYLGEYLNREEDHISGPHSLCPDPQVVTVHLHRQPVECPLHVIYLSAIMVTPT